VDVWTVNRNGFWRVLWFRIFSRKSIPSEATARIFSASSLKPEVGLLPVLTAPFLISGHLLPTVCVPAFIDAFRTSIGSWRPQHRSDPNQTHRRPVSESRVSGSKHSETQTQLAIMVERRCSPSSFWARGTEGAVREGNQRSLVRPTFRFEIKASLMRLFRS